MAPVKILPIAFIGNLLFFGAELAGGIWSGSLALISDSLHLLGDAIAVAIAWGADRFSRRPASEEYTFGRERAKALSAVASVVFLATIMASVIVPEAISRLLRPTQILSAPMLIVAALGLVWNAWLRRRLEAEPHEHHLRGAKLHVDLDFYASIGVLGTGGLIWLTRLTWLDPLVSLFVVGTVAVAGWQTFSRARDELLDMAPKFNWELLEQRIREKLPPNVVIGLHHQHLRSVGGALSVSFHLQVAEGAAASELKQALHTLLHDEFQVEHHTVLTETETDLCCECVFQKT